MGNAELAAKVVRLVQAYCGKDWTMPSQQVQALLMVMMRDGITIPEITQVLNIEQPSVTRAFSVLKGHGLISTYTVNRRVAASLTRVGESLLREIEELK